MEWVKYKRSKYNKKNKIKLNQTCKTYQDGEKDLNTEFLSEAHEKKFKKIIFLLLQ